MKQKFKSLVKKIIKKSLEKHVAKNAVQLSLLGIVAGALLTGAQGNKLYFYAGEIFLLVCIIIFAFGLIGLLLINNFTISHYKKYKVKIAEQKKIKRIENEKKLIVNARKNALTKKFCRHDAIRVGFYSDIPSLMTTYETVYDAMVVDKRFEPIYLGYPQVDLNQISNYEILDYFEEKNLPFEKMYNEETFEYVDLASLDLDYIFFNRHYISRRPSCVKTDVLRKDSVLCMIPYVASPAGGATLDTVCRFDEMRDFDVLFAENEEMLKTYIEYRKKGQAENVKLEVVGSPKYDAIYYSDYITEESKYKQVILYTPRWRTSEGTCSFFELKDYFFQLVEENPDIKYIFRPHPLMVIEIGKKDMGMAKWTEFAKTFEKYENASIDLDGDYRDSFKQATVIVSDISSMMIEFLITGKPVIYFCMKDMLSPFNESLASGYYFASSMADVERYLELLKDGVDPLAEERQRLIKDTMMLGETSAAEKIKEYILKDFNSYRK